MGMHAQKGDTAVSEKPLIKNIPFSEPLPLSDLVEYQDGRVVSRTFAQNQAMSLTLFAFDVGEGLSTHTANGDAFVQVLDGQASITIGEDEFTVKTGETIVMPANVPHSVQAHVRFKMLLVVVKAA
jgi:quercetin dioxygenase-like cupin family protein